MNSSQEKPRDKKILLSAPKSIILLDLKEDYTETVALSDSLNLILWLHLIVIVVGLLGNMGNIVVFGRRSMRQSSTFRFLFYLSVFDLLVLVVCSAEAFLKFRFFVEIRNISSLICRLHTFLTYFLPQCSSNILMAVSIDRALIITNVTDMFDSPSTRLHKRSGLCGAAVIRISFSSITRIFHRVDLIMLLLTIGLSTLNIHYFIFMDLNLVIETHTDQNQFTFDFVWQVCYPSKDSIYTYFLTSVWTWIDMCAFFLIPFLVMTWCSVVILITIKRNNRLFLNTLPRLNSLEYKRRCQRRLKRNRQIIYMLLTANTYFLVSSLPYSIMSVGLLSSDTVLVQPLVHLILYTNNAFNFIFYGFSF